MYDEELIVLREEVEQLRRNITANRLLPGPGYDLCYDNDGMVIHRLSADIAPIYSNSFTCRLTDEYDTDGDRLIEMTPGRVYWGDRWLQTLTLQTKFKVGVIALAFREPDYTTHKEILVAGKWEDFDHTRYDHRVLAETSAVNGVMQIEQRWIAGDIHIMDRWW